jgi:hypothetical protein
MFIQGKRVMNEVDAGRDRATPASVEEQGLFKA